MFTEKQIKNAAYLIGGGVVLYQLVNLLFRDRHASSLNTQNCKPSYPGNWYVVAADQIYQAGFDIGTDEQAIYQIMEQIQTNCDFEYLFNAFGVRTYAGDIIPTPWLSANLAEYLQAELNWFERGRINSDFEQKGITYRV